VASTLKIDPEKQRLTLSVGELTRRIAADGSDSESPSFSLRGKMGGETHRAYQEKRRRSSSYRQEVHLNVNLETGAAPPGWTVRIRGRLDGLLEEDGTTIVEEIKTIALPSHLFASFPFENRIRHFRQLQIYLYLLSLSDPTLEVRGRLVFINLPDDTVRTYDVPYNQDEIEPLVATIVYDLISRETLREEERPGKKAAARSLSFPFPDLRIGQDDIIERVAEHLTRGGGMLLEAPTGLGKTAAVLFAVVRYALGNDRQVLYLTAKTTHQDVAFETAGLIRGANTFPRILLLRAKQKFCPLPEMVCHPDHCTYLTDFPMSFRRSVLREDFLSRHSVHPDDIAAAGEREQLCPYEIQSAIADEYDLIIGDYNYAFDPGCRLNSLFNDRDPARLVLIVDEVHNLPDRARTYYSAVLEKEIIRAAKNHLLSVKTDDFDAPLSALESLFRYYTDNAPPDPDPYPIQLSPAQWEGIRSDFETAIKPYWYRLMQTEHSTNEDPVIRCFRQLETFVRILSLEGEPFVHLIRRHPEISLEINCLDASGFLNETFSSVYGSVGMSATLQPFDFALQRMGLGGKAVCVAFSDPYPAENRRIIVDPGVSTVYRHRRHNYPIVARKITRFRELCRSRVLAFFPSFEFMKQVVDLLEIDELYVQEEGMTDFERNQLLEAFRRSDQGLLCSVMGGVFAEGIDLPGDLTQAAVIVGVGLPYFGTENEMLRAYYDRRGENGFKFAYRVPGMQRVIQSVGRVIRGEDDRGVILLLDQRFAEEEYQRLFPEHWYNQSPAELICEDWEKTVQEFAKKSFLRE
jgi:DNA excision repair protein ERCC-2